MTTARKTPMRRAAPKPARPRPKKKKPPAVVESATLAPIAAASPPPEPVSPDIEPESTAPEPAFAARVPAPAPERPFPADRRAIFLDVENTSRAEHIARVIQHLGVDRRARRTDFVAVGNWRVVGHDTARLLSTHGAQLVHSAPSVGVRDWSDLRIAVSAGVWLGGARPGDVIEVVSDDRAFDAVGDVAASLGIAFHRLSYRALAGMRAEAPVTEAEATGEPRGRHRRRGRRREWPAAAPAPRPSPPVIAAVPRVPPPAPAAPPPGAGPHTAPHDEILAVIRDLIHASADGRVTIDTVANALKARGFSRPPGSPRLITRLRRLRELEVSRSGMVTLAADGHPGEGRVGELPFEGDEPERREPAPEPVLAAHDQHVEPERDEPRQPLEPPPMEAEQQIDEEADSIGNRALPPPAPGTAPSEGQRRRRRRSRRGGRRRHHRPGATPMAS